MTEATDSDVRVEVRVRNHLLLSRMEEKGITSVSELCRRIGFPAEYERLCKLANMKLAARNSDGDWLKVVLEIADVLDCQPEDLFSEAQQYGKLKTNKNTFAIPIADVYRLSGFTASAAPDKELQMQEMRAALVTCLDTLKARDKRIVCLYFGFGCKEMSVGEIARIYRMSGTNVHSIVDKALRRLRWSPGRLRLLKSAVGISSRPTGYGWSRDQLTEELFTEPDLPPEH